MSWLLFILGASWDLWPHVKHLSGRSISLLLRAEISKQAPEHPVATRQIVLRFPGVQEYSFGTAATRWHSRIDISLDVGRPDMYFPPLEFMLGSFGVVYFFMACVSVDVGRDALATGDALMEEACCGAASAGDSWHRCGIAMLGGFRSCLLARHLGCWSFLGKGHGSPLPSCSPGAQLQPLGSPVGSCPCWQGSMGCWSSEPWLPLHRPHFLLLMTMRKFP